MGGSADGGSDDGSSDDGVEFVGGVGSAASKPSPVMKGVAKFIGGGGLAVVGGMFWPTLATIGTSTLISGAVLTGVGMVTERLFGKGAGSGMIRKLGAAMMTGGACLLAGPIVPAVVGLEGVYNMAGKDHEGYRALEYIGSMFNTLSGKSKVQQLEGSSESYSTKPLAREPKQGEGKGKTSAQPGTPSFVDTGDGFHPSPGPYRRSTNSKADDLGHL